MASITCGNCKATHGSSREVRQCYGMGEGNVRTRTEEAAENAAGAYRQQTFADQPIAKATTATVEPPATEKQVAYLESLLADRVHGIVDTAMYMTGIRTSKAAASEAIKFLLSCEKAAMPQPQAESVSVPAGYYAVPSATGNNDLDFFCVQVPTEGKWKGYSFVKRVVGGRPELSIQGPQARIVKERIQDAGVEEAAALYGKEIGRCGRCNRTLTDETSRALGIGPVCRELGW